MTRPANAREGEADLAQPGKPSVLIAATAIGAAEAFARRQGLRVVLTLTRAEVLMSPRRLRQLVRASGARRAVIHTVDWEREGSPQLYEAVSAIMPLRDTLVADDATGRQRSISRGERWTMPLRLGCDVAVGTASLVREHRQLVRRRLPAGGYRLAQTGGRSVMAIWLGGLGSQVGGSVTHMAGILNGFRVAGLNVAVLTAGVPPHQIAESADCLVPLPGMRPGERLTFEIERIAANKTVRDTTARLLEDYAPGFVYQRHRAFLTAGLDTARRAGVPLVLEWNASEVWAFDHWEHASPLKAAFRGTLDRRERLVVREAALVVAVSDHAADMALAAGADPQRVVCVPNGVDVRGVDLVGERHPPAYGRALTVGWIGTFGPWHGADILIRALALLSPDIRLVMIGDGSQRGACQRLARELSVDHRIEWTGMIPHGDAVARLLNCDLLASPHVPLPLQPFFGSPTKLFEYMATGRPIVASGLAQIGDVLDHGRTGWLVEPGSPQALAHGISEVLARPDRGAALGIAARLEAFQRHTWQARAHAILSALDERACEASPPLR